MRIDLQADQAMAETVRRRPRPWLRLLNQVLQLTQGQGELIRHDERPWASATFAGSRHRVLLAFTGAAALEAGETFIAALPEHEFAIPGQVVVDAAIIGVTHDMLPGPKLIVETELLLVEES